VNALFQLGAVSDLWATPYGRALLLKLALLAAVAALGWHHWRRAGPRLGTAEAVPPLRRSIRAEVALGALVLLVTAVLVALPTP
jgi:copper transport protein